MSKYIILRVPQGVGEPWRLPARWSDCRPGGVRQRYHHQDLVIEKHKGAVFESLINSLQRTPDAGGGDAFLSVEGCSRVGTVIADYRAAIRDLRFTIYNSRCKHVRRLVIARRKH